MWYQRWSRLECGWSSRFAWGATCTCTASCSLALGVSRFDLCMRVWMSHGDWLFSLQVLLSCFWIELWCLASCGATCQCLFDFDLVTHAQLHDRFNRVFSSLAGHCSVRRWGQLQQGLQPRRPVCMSPRLLDRPMPTTICISQCLLHDSKALNVTYMVWHGVESHA